MQLKGYTYEVINLKFPLKRKVIRYGMPMAEVSASKYITMGIPATGYHHVLSEATCCHFFAFVLRHYHNSNTVLGCLPYRYFHQFHPRTPLSTSLVCLQPICRSRTPPDDQTCHVMKCRRIDIHFGARLLVHTVIHFYPETIAPEIFSVSRSSRGNSSSLPFSCSRYCIGYLAMCTSTS